MFKLFKASRELGSTNISKVNRVIMFIQFHIPQLFVRSKTNTFLMVLLSLSIDEGYSQMGQVMSSVVCSFRLGPLMRIVYLALLYFCNHPVTMLPDDINHPVTI